jgi:hypothetical protein
MPAWPTFYRAGKNDDLVKSRGWDVGKPDSNGRVRLLAISRGMKGREADSREVDHEEKGEFSMRWVYGP